MLVSIENTFDDAQMSFIVQHDNAPMHNADNVQR